MASALPISAIVPILNSAQLLPEHLASMEAWLDCVQEVIVVDSHSDDGSMDIIRSRLQHPHLRIVQHPRGLYQSWNHGIQLARAKYCYMSTVGDSISVDGLRQLHDIAENLTCDVVVSKPTFIQEDGGPAEQVLWPIDDILSTLDVLRPIRLAGLPLALFTAVSIPRAILGSSASNLYRTQIFQARPFPLDYGTAGDVAWGAINVFDYTLGVSAARFSTFRHHSKSYARSAYAVDDLSRKLFRLFKQVWDQRLGSDSALQLHAARAGCAAILESAEARLDYQILLEIERDRALHWMINPAAWRARSERNRCRKSMHERKREALRSLGAI